MPGLFCWNKLHLFCACLKDSNYYLFVWGWCIALGVLKSLVFNTGSCVHFSILHSASTLPPLHYAWSHSVFLSLSCIHLFHGPVEGCECYQGRAWCGAACLTLVHHGYTQATFQARQSCAAPYRGPSCRPNCHITAWRMASYQVFKPSGRSICWRIWEVWSSRVMNGEKWCCQSGLPLAVSLLCCLSFLFSFPQPETALSSLTKSLFSLLLFFCFSCLLVEKSTMVSLKVWFTFHFLTLMLTQTWITFFHGTIFDEYPGHCLQFNGNGKKTPKNYNWLIQFTKSVWMICSLTPSIAQKQQLTAYWSEKLSENKDF